MALYKGLAFNLLSTLEKRLRQILLSPFGSEEQSIKWFDEGQGSRGGYIGHNIEILIFALRTFNLMKIHIKQAIISRQHIQTAYRWQENLRREKHVELTGTSQGRIWIAGEEETALGLPRGKVSDNPNFWCLHERKQRWSSQSSQVSEVALGEEERQVYNLLRQYRVLLIKEGSVNSGDSFLWRLFL